MKRLRAPIRSAARKSRWARLLIELGLPLAAFAAVLAWQGRHLIGAGHTTPDVLLTDLDGHRHALSEYRGKPVALTFWAPWCPICKAEVGALSGLQRSVGSDAVVVSVALDYPDVASVRRFIAEHHVDYPVLLGDERVARAFHVDAFPTTYFLDAQGRIRHATTGYTSGLGFRLRLWH